MAGRGIEQRAYVWQRANRLRSYADAWQRWSTGRAGALISLVIGALLSLCGFLWMQETHALDDAKQATATVVAVSESLLDRPPHVSVRFRTPDGAEQTLNVTRYGWAHSHEGDRVQIEYAIWDGGLVAQQAGYRPGLALRGGLLAAGGLLALAGGAALAWTYRRPDHPHDPTVAPPTRPPAGGWQHRLNPTPPPRY